MSQSVVIIAIKWYVIWLIYMKQGFVVFLVM